MFSTVFYLHNFNRQKQQCLPVSFKGDMLYKMLFLGLDFSKAGTSPSVRYPIQQLGQPRKDTDTVQILTSLHVSPSHSTLVLTYFHFSSIIKSNRNCLWNLSKASCNMSIMQLRPQKLCSIYPFTTKTVQHSWQSS